MSEEKINSADEEMPDNELGNVAGGNMARNDMMYPLPDMTIIDLAEIQEAKAKATPICDMKNPFAGQS